MKDDQFSAKTATCRMQSQMRHIVGRIFTDLLHLTLRRHDVDVVGLLPYTLAWNVANGKFFPNIFLSLCHSPPRNTANREGLWFCIFSHIVTHDNLTNT